MTRVKVVYLEQNPDDQATENWVALFKEAGIDAEVEIVNDITNVETRANEGLCDVFVCDLTLNKDEGDNLQGIKLLARIKRKFPFILTVGTTSARPSYIAIDDSDVNFDLFVPKTAVRNRAFKKPNYPQRIQRHLKVLPRIEVEVPQTLQPPLDEENDPPLGSAELKLLVRQLFATELPVDASTLPKRVRLDQLTGGRSKSSVFALHVNPHSGGRRFIPAIIKVSALPDHHAELERYDRLVKWSLPYTSRVDVLGKAETSSRGAIAYSFAHGGENFDTLTALLQAKNHDRAMQAIDSVFDHAQNFWCVISNEEVGTSLRQRYFERYFDSGSAKWEQTETKMAAAASNAGLSFELHRTDLTIAGFSFPKLLAKLPNVDHRNFNKSLCHGDLNTNNIIVSQQGSIALIDFRDAAIGHVFEDIMTLEACVRLFWGDDKALAPSDADPLFKELYQLETELTKGRPGSGKSEMWQLIAHIRQRAFETFPSEPKPTYLFGLAYYCFRLMRIHSTPISTVRLLACFVASAVSLLPSDENGN